MAAMQMNTNMPANLMFVPPPGMVRPYSLLPNDNDDLLEPISSFAIKESGGYGPLNEEQLKKFLRRKLDTRVICSREVVVEYTTDFPGLYRQLDNLLNRINEIKREEKKSTDFFKKRIRECEKALKENKPFPNAIHICQLSKAADEAFQYAGSQGPLSKDELLDFVHTPRSREIPKYELIKQLQVLRLRIHDNVDIEKSKLKLPYDRVTKALNDILQEILCEIPRSSRT